MKLIMTQDEIEAALNATTILTHIEGREIREGHAALAKIGRDYRPVKIERIAMFASSDPPAFVLSDLQGNLHGIRAEGQTDEIRSVEEHLRALGSVETREATGSEMQMLRAKGTRNAWNNLIQKSSGADAEKIRELLALDEQRAESP